MKVETPKHGFVLYFDRVELAARNLDDQKLGQLCRAIFMRTPKPKFDAPELSICYDFLVDGIKQNYKLYDETKKKRRYNYLLNKPQRTPKQEAELRELSLYLNLQEKTSTSTSTSTSTPSETVKYKNYNEKNKIFIGNKIYVRNYLSGKKLFLKKDAFDEFCEYNDGLGWPLKPETAFRRWIKNNPEDEEKPKNEKKPPEQPATPPALVQTWENVINYIIDSSLCTVVQRKSLEKLTLVAMQQTTSGYLVTLGAPSKSTAEVVRDQLKQALKCAFDHFFGSLFHVEFVFPGATEMLYFTDEHLDPLAPPKTILMPDRVKALLNIK